MPCPCHEHGADQKDALPQQVGALDERYFALTLRTRDEHLHSARVSAHELVERARDWRAENLVGTPVRLRPAEQAGVVLAQGLARDAVGALQRHVLHYPVPVPASDMVGRAVMSPVVTALNGHVVLTCPDHVADGHDESCSAGCFIGHHAGGHGACTLGRFLYGWSHSLEAAQEGVAWIVAAPSRVRPAKGETVDPCMMARAGSKMRQLVAEDSFADVVVLADDGADRRDKACNRPIIVELSERSGVVDGVDGAVRMDGKLALRTTDDAVRRAAAWSGQEEDLLGAGVEQGLADGGHAGPVAERDHSPELAHSDVLPHTRISLDGLQHHDKRISGREAVDRWRTLDHPGG